MHKVQLGWINDKEKKQHVYKKGDQVWLDGCNIKMYHPTAKLALKRHRPFPVQRVLSTIDYQLTIPEQWKIHNVFHVDLLVMIDLLLLVVGHWGYTGELKRRRITMRRA